MTDFSPYLETTTPSTTTVASSAVTTLNPQLPTLDSSPEDSELPATSTVSPSSITPSTQPTTVQPEIFDPSKPVKPIPLTPVLPPSLGVPNPPTLVNFRNPNFQYPGQTQFHPYCHPFVQSQNQPPCVSNYKPVNQLGGFVYSPFPFTAANSLCNPVI